MGGPGTQGQTLLSLSVVQVRGPEPGPFATLPHVGTFVNHLEIFWGGVTSQGMYVADISYNIDTRGTDKCPTTHRAALTTKNWASMMSTVRQ